MRDVKIKKYLKKLDYSYTFGVFTTIELLKYKPTKVIKVILNPKGTKNTGTEKIKYLCKKNNIRYEYNLGHIRKIAFKENTYAVGIFQKYSDPIDDLSNHIMLVNPMDMGNLGTIIRTMAGFDFSNLVIIKPAVDIFDPKVLSSTMGGLFHINFELIKDIDIYLENFEFHNLYSFMLNGKHKLGSTKFKKPYTLVFGNESSGLDKSFSELGQSIVIEHSKNIDSLNLAVSAGIAMKHSYNK